MRVVSWNIDARGDGLRERIGQLASFDADILLLQEAPRRAASLLSAASGVAWAELSVLHSEPAGGPSARIGTAILGSERVYLRKVGQIPEQRFIDAGAHAGLSEFEVRERTGWLHRNLYADLEVDGVPVRVCSLHARPATGGVPGRPPLGYTRQVFHRVCADWIAEHDGTALFGIDANGPFIDHPELDRWQSSMAGDATLIGPEPKHHLTDAMYRWLATRPDEFEAIRRSRPDGPLAVSYVTTGSKRPCRYDHVYVTDDIDVDDILYRSPYSDGSDHGAVVTNLTIRQPCLRAALPLPSPARNFAAMDPLDSLTPDPRWESLGTTHGDLAAASDDWPVAAGAPPEVARILVVSRHLFCNAWFIYDFLMVAAVQSLIAVEAALRDLLDERPRRGGPGMRNLVERAVSQGLIARERGDNVLAGVELRNSWVHVRGQKVISPGMVQQVVAVSHAVIADLYSSRAAVDVE